MGYEAIEAQSGREGIECARNAHPNLIILDLGLPDISGLEVLALLKQDSTTVGIPIIVYTAWATHTIRAKALNAGADAVLFKPHRPAVLNETIKTILELPRSTSDVNWLARTDVHG